jgi:hypothetical protein
LRFQFSGGTGARKPYGWYSGSRSSRENSSGV